jgi:hypothetical protein
MAGIFISYRREDGTAYAGRLYDHLANHFGKDNVFMDVDTIEPGVDFVDVVQKTVSSCDALIAVIGKQWLTATDRSGRRRLDDPDDLVRLEIATALARKIRVVPALVGGGEMPRSEDLPEALAPLARRNALTISDLAFQESVGRLIVVLKKTTSPLEHPSQHVPDVAAPSAAVERAVIDDASARPRNRRATSETPAAVGLSKLRAALLQSRPQRAASWFFYVLFALSAGMAILGVIASLGGQFKGPSDWGFLGGFVVAAFLSWTLARWLGK